MGAEPTYPVARAAAARIHDHFIRHLSGRQGQDLAPLADVETVEAIVNAGFWASLRREEGYVPRISLAFVAPEQVIRPLLFESSIPLAAKALTKVGPAVERPGIHLGVWREGGELSVWGAATNLPMFCFVLEVDAPGVLVIKHSRGPESRKFVNVAVLQGDRIKIIDQRAAALPDCPGLLTSLMNLESQSMSEESVSLLIQLAVSMRMHGRGGSLLVVPSGTESWRESIRSPVAYSVAPPLHSIGGQTDSPYEIRRGVDAIAGLTAVDGATILTDRYELLAFGAKIVRRSQSTIVDQVIVTEPVEGVEPAIVDPAQLGGTRHLSAAQFASDQREAISMVASQDGRFTVFGWSKREKMVHAHRIETLLL